MRHACPDLVTRLKCQNLASFTLSSNSGLGSQTILVLLGFHFCQHAGLDIFRTQQLSIMNSWPSKTPQNLKFFSLLSLDQRSTSIKTTVISVKMSYKPPWLDIFDRSGHLVHYRHHSAGIFQYEWHFLLQIYIDISIERQLYLFPFKPPNPQMKIQNRQEFFQAFIISFVLE